jgi:hypothetical protein
MPVPNYAQIIEMWRTQHRRFDERDELLQDHAKSLRDAVELFMDPPKEEWEIRPGQLRRYVEILDLSTDPMTFRQKLAESAITDEGELYFAISFTLKHPQKPMAKILPHIAVVVRLRDGLPEYNFWDVTGHVPGKGGWVQDHEQFAQDVIARLSKRFASNPLKGPLEKLSIGFTSS